MAELRDSLLRALLAHLESGQGLALALATQRCCPAGGATGCACWRPEFDLDQTDPPAETVVNLIRGRAELPTRPRMCGDCAYRPGSPERSGDENYRGDAAELDRYAREETFFCHDGMRKPIAWRHPSGVRIPAVHGGDYQPPIVEGVPYRADGQPGLLCAGWAARRRALTACRASPDESPTGASG